MGDEKLATKVIRYERARAELEALCTIDEVKDFSDKAKAMAAYGRQAHDPELEFWGADLRFLSYWRLGDLSLEIETSAGGRPRKDTGKTSISGDRGFRHEAWKKAKISLATGARAVAIARAGKAAARYRKRKTTEKSPPSVSEFLREVARAKQIRELRKISQSESIEPEGPFDVVVIDPPWPMEKIERDVRPNQVAFDYPTMTEDELAEEDLRAADDCHVWLWTTHRFMPMAFRLLDAWDLKYICIFVWHKPGGFQPIGLPQYNCEFALYARKGSPIFVSTKNLPVCFEASRGKHSEKPAEFYDMVRRVTAGRRRDMFARREINGFQGSGKEAT